MHGLVPAPRAATRSSSVRDALAASAIALALLLGSAAQASHLVIDACECLLRPGDAAVVSLDYSNTEVVDAQLVVLLRLPNGKEFYLSPIGLVESVVPWVEVPAGSSPDPVDIFDVVLTADSLPFGNWPLVPPFRYEFEAALFNPATGTPILPFVGTFFDFEPAPPSPPPTEPGLLHLFPHQHADVAWITREDANLPDAADWIADSMVETTQDPSYRFVIDQPFVLQAFSLLHPDKVSGLDFLLKGGVAEVAGGYFVTSDLNLLAGESLARQAIYGQRYLEDAWGLRARAGWHLDAFGHPHQMPQITVKGGMDRYAFSRGIRDLADLGLTGTEFYWESPDGSRVLANNLPFGYQLGRSVGDVSPDDQELTEIYRNLQPLSLTGNFLTGNGADVSEHVLNPLLPEAVGAWNAVQALGVEARLSTATEFFDAIESSGVSLPTISDAEFQNDGEPDDPRIFPGAWASRIGIKQTNQQLETRLLDVEKLFTMAWIEGSAYPEASLADQGRRIAINQFHDYLPGTGIDEIYEDPDSDENDYGDRAAAASAALGQHLVDASSYLMGLIGTELAGATVHHAFVVFNTMAWERRDVVRIPVDWAALVQPSRLVDSKGREIAYQRALDATQNDVLVFVADVPAMGYATFYLVAGAPAQDPLEVPDVVGVGGRSLDLGAFTASFDGRGFLRGLFADSTGEALVLLPDEPPTIDSLGGVLWWADETYGNSYDYGPPLVIGSQADSLPTAFLLTGPVMSRVVVSTSVGDGSFSTREVQAIPDLGRLEFDTTVVWSEFDKNLYVRFPFVAREGALITEGVPYGHRVRGPGHQPVLRWADYGDSTAGVSILNQALFGHNFSLDPLTVTASTVEPQTLDITLMRSLNRAVFGEYASELMKENGLRRFRYALAPHTGSWRTAQTPRRAWEFGAPLLGFEAGVHAGTLPPESSYLSLNAASDAIVSVMQREGDDVVVRLYETQGVTSQHELRFPHLDAATVDRTNFLGDFIETLGSGSEVQFSVVPEEIATLRLNAATAVVPEEPPLDLDFQRGIDLLTAGQPAFVGIDADDQSGRSVSAVGDIDGDGYDDLLIGAIQGDGADNLGDDGSGEAYVVFGGPQVSLGGGAPLDQAGITLYGYGENGSAGRHVASGDLDCDGFSDIVVSSITNPTGEEARNLSGVIWVVFGGARETLASSVDLQTEADLEIWGQGGDIAGVHLALADVDADGCDDLAITAPSADSKDDLSESAGEVHLIFGGTRADVVQSGTRVLGFHQDAVIWGFQPNDNTGWTVEAGDIDADGYDDLVFSAIDADGSTDTQEAAGDVYVFWGGPRATFEAPGGGPGEFFTETLDNMTVFYGESAGDLAGFDVSVGDVDGDGFGDLLIGAPFADGLDDAVGDSAGQAFLVFGRPRAAFGQTNELASVADVIIYGGLPSEATGREVEVADLSGDGLADLVIAAPTANGFQGQRPASGTVHVLLGRPQASWPSAMVLNGQNSNFLIRGATAFESAGGALAVGDVDGDGRLDLAVGAPTFALGATQRLGATYLLYGDFFETVTTDEVTITRAEYDPVAGILKVDAEKPVGGGVFLEETEVMLFDPAQTPMTQQLTDDSTDAVRLDLRGGTAVWERLDGVDTEIFRYDGSLVALTDNTTDDNAPRADGSAVVWQGFDGNDFEIYYSDGALTQQLTDNDVDDLLPVVSGDHVAWQGFDGNDFEIYVWPGAFPILQLSDNAGADQGPSIDAGEVAWFGEDGGDFDVFHWDGSSVLRLTDDAEDDVSVEISGGEVVWLGFDGNDFEVFHWDGATVHQRSDNAVTDASPHIRSGRVVWSSGQGDAAEIVLWESGTGAVQLTTDSVGDALPSLDEAGRVAWQRASALPDGPSEIHYWDGAQVQILSDAGRPDTQPVADGGQVAWLRLSLDSTLSVPGIGDLVYDPQTGSFSGEFALQNPPPSLTVSSPLGGEQTVEVVTLPAADGALTIQQLTDNGQPFPEQDVSIFENQVVWAGFDGTDFEIFFFDGVRTVQITDDDENDLNPAVWDGIVVWEHSDGSDPEIWLWDGSETRALTDNDLVDTAPQIQDGSVVWQSSDGAEADIWMYRRGARTRITYDGKQNGAPDVHGQAVVWQAFDGNDFEIFRWERGVTTQITDDAHNDLDPQIDGGVIVWRGSDGVDFEIERWVAGATTVLTQDEFDADGLDFEDGVAVWHQSDGVDPEIHRFANGQVDVLTDNDIIDVLPQTQGGAIAWQAQGSSGFEIWVHDGVGTAGQLTANTVPDVNPQIFGGSIAWTSGSGGGVDVLLFDGSATRNLTSGRSLIPDSSPSIAAGRIAWQGWDGDPEIFVSDGTDTLQLSDDVFEDFLPQVDPVTGMVVWHSLDDLRMRLDAPGQGEGGTGALVVGGDFEIYLWDGASLTQPIPAVTQLTDRDSLDDFDPRIYDGQVVWVGGDGNDTEVFFFDGLTTVQLTDNDHDEQDPRIHAGQLVWQGWDGSDMEIFFYDATLGSPVVQQITNNTGDDVAPEIDAGVVVWAGWDGSDFEVMQWSAGSTVPLTDNTGNDVLPQIDAGQVVWQGFDGNDFEIYLRNGGTTTQLTNNALLDEAPRIDGGRVVWQASDGFDLEIFYWDGSLHRVTDNLVDDAKPDIDGGTFTWQGFDGNDFEILFVEVPAP